MKPAPLRYLRPTTVGEACAALAEHAGEARPLAGGQSLVPLLNLRLAQPTALVDLNRIARLDGIEVRDGAVVVGALARQRALERDPAVAAACPLLPQALRHVGHVATRNRGTVGGSLAHADPAAELPVVLVCLGGSVVAAGPRGRRELTADALFAGYLANRLEPDELLVEARFPVLGAGWGTAFLEVAPRHGDFALGLVACAVRVADGRPVEVRLAAGAVDERPVRLGAAEAAACSGAADAEVAAAARAAVDPVGMPQAPAAYQRQLVGVLAARAVRAAVEAAA